MLNIHILHLCTKNHKSRPFLSNSQRKTNKQKTKILKTNQLKDYTHQEEKQTKQTTKQHTTLRWRFILADEKSEICSFTDPFIFADSLMANVTHVFKAYSGNGCWVNGSTFCFSRLLTYLHSRVDWVRVLNYSSKEEKDGTSLLK